MEKDEVCGGYVVALQWGSAVVADVKGESGETRERQKVCEARGPKIVASDTLQKPKGKEIKFKVGKPRQKRTKNTDHVIENTNKQGLQLAVREKIARHGNDLDYDSSLGDSESSRSLSPAMSSMIRSRSSSPLGIPTGVTYSSLADRMGGLLEMCKFYPHTKPSNMLAESLEQMIESSALYR